MILVTIFTVFLTPSTVESVEIKEEVIKVQTPQHSNKIKNLAKVILRIETGDTLDCSLTGLSGEQGCFQFLPSTWEAYSKEVYGYVVPVTQENEQYIVEEKIKKWKDKGFSDRDILLIWNQGNAGPCKSGINKHGVEYDSCAYADKGLELLKSFVK